nr:MAG TPA: hypothetical protein [Caudoviricetes sp.]
MTPINPILKKTFAAEPRPAFNDLSRGSFHLCNYRDEKH